MPITNRQDYYCESPTSGNQTYDFPSINLENLCS